MIILFLGVLLILAIFSIPSFRATILPKKTIPSRKIAFSLLIFCVLIITGFILLGRVLTALPMELCFLSLIFGWCYASSLAPTNQRERLFISFVGNIPYLLFLFYALFTFIFTYESTNDPTGYGALSLMIWVAVSLISMLLHTAVMISPLLIKRLKLL
ncbi:MAG: hypothetical protein ACRCWQ_11635 [Bacilli bacterium]